MPPSQSALGGWGGALQGLSHGAQLLMQLQQAAQERAFRRDQATHEQTLADQQFKASEESRRLSELLNGVRPGQAASNDQVDAIRSLGAVPGLHIAAGVRPGRQVQIRPDAYLDLDETPSAIQLHASENERAARTAEQFAAESRANGEWTRRHGMEVADTEHLAKLRTDVPAFVFPTGVDANGNPVVLRANTKTGAVEATGQGARPAQQGGNVEIMKRQQAFLNVSKALDSLEADLTQHGSVIMPGVEKSALSTDYGNVRLQMKELYNLGVLNGPDLALMTSLIGDPTSFTGRINLSLHPGDEQKNRVLAQLRKVREKIQGFQQSLATASGARSPGATPSSISVQDDAELSTLMKKYGITPIGGLPNAGGRP